MWAKTLQDCHDASDYAYCTCAVYSCGYSQPKRTNISIARLQNGTAETDCSAGVSWWLFMGGLLDENPWFHTAIERDYLLNHGFTTFPFGALPLKRNDVLLRVAKTNVLGHTALYIGEGLQAEAVRDENHQAGYEGTIPGDNDGGETVVNNVTNDWDYVFRSIKVLPTYEGILNMTFLFTCDGKHKGHVWYYDSGKIFLVKTAKQKTTLMQAYHNSTKEAMPFFHLENGDDLFAIVGSDL